MSNSIVKNLDWVSVILYLLLVSFGWIAIFSTTYSDLKASSIFDLNQFYGKQLLFIALSFLLILFILAIDSKLYINLAVTFYLIAIVLLAGLFVFGKETNGARHYGAAERVCQSSYCFGFFALCERHSHRCAAHTRSTASNSYYLCTFFPHLAAARRRESIGVLLTIICTFS